MHGWLEVLGPPSPCYFIFLLIFILLLPDDVVSVWVLLANELGVEHGEHKGRRVDRVGGIVAPVGTQLLCTGWTTIIWTENSTGFPFNEPSHLAGFSRASDNDLCCTGHCDTTLGFW